MNVELCKDFATAIKHEIQAAIDYKHVNFPKPDECFDSSQKAMSEESEQLAYLENNLDKIYAWMSIDQLQINVNSKTI